MRRFAKSTTVHEKQFHACDSIEMLMKTKMVLVQARMYQNNNKHSLKSRRKHSYDVKHKKRQKCNTSHGKWAYPKTVDLSVPTSPRCDVGCQRCKVDVRNELCGIKLMSFDNIEVVTCIAQI